MPPPSAVSPSPATPPHPERTAMHSQVTRNQDLTDRTTQAFQRTPLPSPTPSSSTDSTASPASLQTLPASPAPSEVDTSLDSTDEMDSVDLMFQHSEKIDLIISESKGRISHVDIFEGPDSLLGYSHTLEKDLQKAFINNFSGLLDLLGTKTFEATTIDITNIFKTIQKLGTDPKTDPLKKELTDNFSGLVELLKANFLLKDIISTKLLKLRTYVFKNTPQIAILTKAGVSLSKLLDLEPETRKEILEYSDQIATVLKSKVATFESILELFSPKIFDRLLPKRFRKSRIAAKERILEEIFKDTEKTIEDMQKMRLEINKKH